MHFDSYESLSVCGWYIKVHGLIYKLPWSLAQQKFLVRGNLKQFTHYPSAFHLCVIPGNLRGKLRKL